MTVASEPEAHPRRFPWGMSLRILLLLATGISLYLLFPSLVAVFACETKPLTLNASVSIMTPARIA